MTTSSKPLEHKNTYGISNVSSHCACANTGMHIEVIITRNTLTNVDKINSSRRRYFLFMCVYNLLLDLLCNPRSIVTLANTSTINQPNCLIVFTSLNIWPIHQSSQNGTLFLVRFFFVDFPYAGVKKKKEEKT